MQMDESLLYDMLSAFCKSLRGSDSDAALAWFARMIYGGVDPRIVMRRVIVHASEDVGMANPMAMQQAVAAYQALEAVGMPEARLAIAQAIIAVCESPKVQRRAHGRGAGACGRGEGRLSAVPQHLRDTHYRGAEKLGSGEGYKYVHDYPGHFRCAGIPPCGGGGFPYYVPSRQGYENDVRALRKTRGFDDPARRLTNFFYMAFATKK